MPATVPNITSRCSDGYRCVLLGFCHTCSLLMTYRLVIFINLGDYRISANSVEDDGD